jgi:hypothetical protein
MLCVATIGRQAIHGFGLAQNALKLVSSKIIPILARYAMAVQYFYSKNWATAFCQKYKSILKGRASFLPCIQ